MKLNLTIRTKVLAGFGLLLVLSAVFAVVATWQVNALQRLHNLAEAKFSIIAQAENTIWELRSGFPLYFASLDPKRRQSIKDKNPDHIRDVRQQLQAYSELPNLTPEESQKLKETQVILERYVSKQPLLFTLFEEGKVDEAQEIRTNWTVPGAIGTVKGITDLRKLAQENNETSIAQTHTTANRLMALTGMLLAILGVGIALYVYRGISRPLKDLQDTVERVRAGEVLMEAEGVKSQDELGVIWHTVHGLLVERRDAQRKAEAENERLNQSVISILESVHQLAQKDLTVRAPVTADVIGTVSDSINALTDETSRVLQGVSQIAGSVALASDKVRSQAEMVSRTAEDERSSVGRMIESLTHATQTMNQVAALAEQSNNSANKATAVTETALEAVNGTVKGMESIRETIAESEKRIKRLGERSQEISGIVNLINTISERTHVLALNASMQAAVAGEAGRGFAVVAEEVQRLAESSRTATQQISTLVNNIQLETNETIGTVNRTISQVVQGSEQAQKAGEQMRMTQKITAELVAQVKRIAEVSEEQREMSAGLLASVQYIGKSTERTADQISAQNRETESLLQSARRLVESVNVFKLPKLA
ncbi:MAG: methyl-accepting chemotaxis protein [Hylemonella sp.]|nr:methyl-accepting chemotaxis protein [Hylemonella sp.]